MTFWFMGITLQQARIVDNLLRPWALAHHTRVSVTPVSASDFTTQVDTAIASGSLPNVMVTSQGYPDIYAFDHLGVDISRYNPKFAAYIKKEEPPLLAAGNTVFHGQVWGALESASPEVAYVNTRVFRQLHLQPPTRWWQLDHETLPVLLKHKLHYAGPGNSEWFWYAVLFSYGGRVYSPDGNKVIMASPAGQAAVKAYLAPYIQDKISTSTGSAQTMADLFAKGSYPYILNGSQFLSNIAAVPNFPTKDWTVAPYPGGPKGDYTWTGGTAVAAFNHGTLINREEVGLMQFFWKANVQRALTERFARQTQTLYTTANMAAWQGLRVKGLTPHDLTVMRKMVADSVGVQSHTRVTKAQVLGMGNTWQAIQNEFTRMTTAKHATLAATTLLLKQAAAILQRGLRQAGG